MAEPARESASRTGSSWEPGRPHPCASGWANVRGLIITFGEAAAATIGELADRPGSQAALKRADLLLAGLGDLTEIARRCVLDEAIMARREAEAYERGAADCKASKCHLEVVPAIPGPH